VRLVGVRGVQSRLREEPAKQAVGATPQWGQTRLQNLKDGTILVISFHKFCVSNFFITLDFVLRKASTGDNPHYLDVW
jgi:hypothetical protein